MNPTKIICIKITILLLLMQASVTGLASPNENTLPISNKFSVEYVLKSGLFTIGKTRRTLTPQGNGLYAFESYTWPAGILSIFYKGDVTERSLWKYQNKMAVPIQYSYIDTNKKSKRDIKLSFDWENKKVTNTINDKPWNMKIKDGTQDKLLYQISIMLDLANNPHIKKLQYTVADGGKLKFYDAKVEKKETIKTPAGQFETLMITRDDGKRVTSLWCAPSLSYLPVRIEHYKKGETKLNAYLTKFSGL